MRLGRLILTHREDLILTLKNFYLPSRTDFLVIAYDRLNVNPAKFEEGNNFRLVPYETDPKLKLNGQQFRVWTNVVRMFPEIEGWVVHDYDMIAKPNDQEIFQHLGEKNYGMIGTSFPVWVEGMTEQFDTYPFPQGHRYWGAGPDLMRPFQALIEAYPTKVGEKETFYGGYGDFLAARSEYFLLMEENPLLRRVTEGGNEQVPHTVWRAHGVLPVDMTRYYRTKVFVDGRYLPERMLYSRYDFLHPLKFWPGGKRPSERDKIFQLKAILKVTIKQLIRKEDWRWKSTKFGGGK